MYNIIIYLYPLFLVGLLSASIWVHMLPWTLIILLFISIANIIIDNDIKNISIKLNTPLILLFLGLQILAVMWFVFTPTTTFFSYHFIMLISLIPLGLAYYIGYKSRVVVDNIEAKKTIYHIFYQ
jgi:hypothetical protein